MPVVSGQESEIRCRKEREKINCNDEVVTKLNCGVNENAKRVERTIGLFVGRLMKYCDKS
jgi:hypothetical protein